MWWEYGTIKQKLSFVILVMALGLFMSSLDNTIVSASINQVIKDIDGLDLYRPYAKQSSGENREAGALTCKSLHSY